MSHTRLQLYVHVVWSTFRRTPWITKTIEKPLYGAICTKGHEMGCVPLAIGGTMDHVHTLVSLPSTLSVATLVKEIKGESAYFVTHKLAPDISFRWQGGYGAFTLRKTDLPIVREYIAKQKQHHRSNTVNVEWEAPTTD